MDIQVGVKATWMFKTIRSTSNSFFKNSFIVNNLTCNRVQDTIFGRNALNPSKRTYFIWLFIVSTAVFYNMVLNLPRICFNQLQKDFMNIFIPVDYLMDVIYILDFYIKSRTSYIHEGMLVDNPKQLFFNYFGKPGQVFFDSLSALPFDHFARLVKMIPDDSIRFSYLPAMLRLNRCLKFPRLIEFVDRAETRTSYPNVFRLLVLVFQILLIVHTNGCIYFGLSRWIKFNYDDDRWVYPPHGVGWETNRPWASLKNQQSR